MEMNKNEDVMKPVPADGGLEIVYPFLGLPVGDGLIKKTG